jgi:hypothetical protein
MLSGVYLILGFYTVSFYQADRTNSISVVAAANSVQAEQLARTGISMALAKMGNNASIPSFTEASSMSDGTISYTAAVSGTKTNITSTATFNGRSISMKAVFTFYNGRWRLTQTYAIPTAEAVS